MLLQHRPRWVVNHFSRKLVLGSEHPLSKEMFPEVKSELPLKDTALRWAAGEAFLLSAVASLMYNSCFRTDPTACAKVVEVINVYNSYVL